MTERVTEDFVRDHFKSDPIFDQISLDEQKSTRERIQRLFAHSSKSQTNNQGFPEFVISFHSKGDLIIIIECKRDTKSHESKLRNNPKGYAVDGVLHYIKHVNLIDKSFDIIGIAVSGSNASKLSITQFYSAADDVSYTEIKDTKLLSIQSYLKLHDHEAFAKELSNLHIQQKAVEYNNALHRYEIPEHERCTLISAVLVALQDRVFRASYKKSADVEELINLVLDACKRVLKKNGITEDRRATIVGQYKSIKGHKVTKLKMIINHSTGKEEENEAILTFIDDIHKEIYPLVLFEEQGFDVLGRFYREFVRYAGSDQATGLVLTPEHIADLFCDLVRLSVDDRVYDPCCGTGGFLISALKRMISLAGHDTNKIKNIKEAQLMGSEVRADMFTYACSNMMMRGDGKSKVFNDDCFSIGQKARVKQFSPTVALLNPPYSKTSSPARQLEFILNALSNVEKNGRCAAIVQMSCALTTRTEIVNQHAEIMKHHRLDAVISTPDQLFYPIAVNTCIMVFTAHVPHPVKHPTWFGYLKNDGFIIHKSKGRIPLNWDERRARLLALYDHYDAAGVAVRRPVKANDEWCAEAYLETDFTVLNKSHFELKLREYLAYQFLCGNVNSLEQKAASTKKPTLDVGKWKTFSYDKIFDIKKGYYNKKPPEIQTDGCIIPFIGATANNNGITSLHDLDDIILYSRNGEENPYEDQNRKLFPGNAITVSNNGSVGYAFFQPGRFTCSHDVNPLYLNEQVVSPELGIFLCTVIEVDRYRWGYGRKWRPARMPASVIRLPVLKSGLPDWNYMENYIRSLDLSSNLHNVELTEPPVASNPSIAAKQDG